MIKRFTFSLVLALSAVLTFGQSSIKGKVVDLKGEPIPFASVALYQNGSLKNGAKTNYDGEFKISNVDAGTYDLEASYVGFQKYRLEGLIVKSGKVLPLEDDIVLSDQMFEVVNVVAYKVPLIDKDGGASGGTVSREDLSRMAGRSAASIASTVGGVQTDGNGAITSVRGSRGDASYYYIDGIKVRGSSSLPKAAIEEVSVMTGGLPANYGDATGGIISITTRGASSFYFGGIEAVTSGFKVGDNKTVGLDKFGYNLIEGILSGPLLMKKDSAGKKTDPLLGFFISGNFTHSVGRGYASDQYRLKPDVRTDLVTVSDETSGPLRPTGSGTGSFYNVDFLNQDSFEQVKYAQNSVSVNASLAGKIDVNLGSDKNLTFGASGNYSNYQSASYNNLLMNSDNNARVKGLDWRAYGKFTQRFQSQLNEDGQSESKISNAYYTLMVDYSNGTQTVQDDTHGENVFGYGHVGTFNETLQREYEFRDYDNDGNIDRVQNAVPVPVNVDFIPSELNSDLAAVTEQYYTLYDDVNGNYDNYNSIQAGGGLLNGQLPQDVYRLWRNIGYQYNGFSKSDNSQIRVTGQGSADIGDHAISIGFEYEQRVDRGYSLSPVALWTRMRSLANSHIAELDLDNPTITNFGQFYSYDFERLNSAPGEYEGTDAQSFFDYNLRQNLGLDPDGTDYIQPFALDPNSFSVDMFSADELLGNGGSNSLVSYYGYDHAGNKLKGKPSFDDFFNAKDEFGNFTREIGAFEPIYMSGYIMDKFAFDDLIFNVGLRLDRFDANQSVLKDRFLLYPARTIAEVSELAGTEVSHPSNLPSNATVYVNDINDPTAIKGYRVDDVWYNSDGIEITGDPTESSNGITTSSGVIPYLAEGVSADDPVSSNAFEDYKPQWTVMPRIAFSFPISDEALFFAHYDVLSKRPTTGNRLNPLDYQFQGTNIIKNNPNLRPEKTIDYELGFQQVLTKKSSLKISGFYREVRDQVTLINSAGAFPETYRTWGNIDFGTIKGMTMAYDLRRSGNVSMRASYTLQFAEGTGSDATSQANLIAAGQPNLRTIFPYNYDQRHQVILTMDYRYGEGQDYNGPVIGGKEIFKNMGANLTSNFASGTPYSAGEFIVGSAFITPGDERLNGTVNGSRKPWNFRADLQVDRNMTLKFGDDKKKSANLNIYVVVNNLFNTKNVLNVYRTTGTADDDGYLNAAQYQNDISNQLDEQSFRNYYALRVNNPFNFGLPRTIRLGVKLDF
ncbi:MAG: spore coat protein U-like protein [Flavobacteriales bacterium]|jgi:hypothetical protein